MKQSMHNGIKLITLFIGMLTGFASVDTDAQTAVNQDPTLSEGISKSISAAPINIGSRLELFINRYIIEALDGEAEEFPQIVDELNTLWWTWAEKCGFDREEINNWG